MDAYFTGLYSNAHAVTFYRIWKEMLERKKRVISVLIYKLCKVNMI